MSKFLRELLIGIAIIILGIWLSVANGYFLFYGLIVVGLFLVILAFVHLSQSKQKKSNDSEVPVIKFYPTDKPQEKARFIESLDSQETLEVPKQVSITCSRSDQSSRVFLNGVEIGGVAPDAPLVFIVMKKNNVINISEQYEGICFFHVVTAEGMGGLKIGMGMQSAAVKIVPNTGLADGIIAVIPNTEHVPSVD
ncbi:MAG TPA: hypothetical protein PKW29_13945 [Clostridia bacterium]|nr:hypothetical protein [Clostridia bacterium]